VPSGTGWCLRWRGTWLAPWNQWIPAESGPQKNELTGAEGYVQNAAIYFGMDPQRRRDPRAGFEGERVAVGERDGQAGFAVDPPDDTQPQAAKTSDLGRASVPSTMATIQPAIPLPRGQPGRGR